MQRFVVYTACEYTTLTLWQAGSSLTIHLQGELAHRLVKRLYGSTNKKNIASQIGKRVRRLERIRHARSVRLRHLSLGLVVRKVTGKIAADEVAMGYRYHVSRSENRVHVLSKMLKKNRNNPAFEVSGVPREQARELTIVNVHGRNSSENYATTFLAGSLGANSTATHTMSFRPKIEIQFIFAVIEYTKSKTAESTLLPTTTGATAMS